MTTALQPPAHDYWYGQSIASGETTIPRIPVGNGAALVSGLAVFSYWTAIKTEICNSILTVSGTVAAGATPTYCAMGVYSVDSAGNLTLLSQCASDTALWAATFNAYSRALTTPFQKVTGQRYAFAPLIVTAAALPVLDGLNGTVQLSTTAPRLASSIAGQAALPASVPAGSLVSASSFYFGAVTP